MRHSLKTTAAIFHNGEGVIMALRGENGGGIRDRNTNITYVIYITNCGTAVSIQTRRVSRTHWTLNHG